MNDTKEMPTNRSANAEEINRLHAEVIRMSAASRDALNAALVAAWQAGQRLVAEKQKIRHAMGHGAWQLWLKRYFAGTPRTAQNYIRLAKHVTDPACLHGLSLRQAYFRLGIATEPKLANNDGSSRGLPKYLTLSMRLLAVLDTERLSPELRTAYRQDLRPLYERLRALF
jgi:lambda repressor-like predicted transcriptional regulator